MHQSIKEPAAPQRDPSASRNGFEMTPPPPGRYAPHPRQTNDRNSANCRTEVRVATPPVTFYVVERLSSLIERRKDRSVRYYFLSFRHRNYVIIASGMNRSGPVTFISRRVCSTSKPTLASRIARTFSRPEI